MFENVGQKIKKVAVIVFWVTVVASFIATFVFIGSIPYPYGFGDYWYIIFLPIIGSLLALISAWCLYGFGELIDNVCDIKHTFCDHKTTTQVKEPQQKELTTEKAEEETTEKTSTKSNVVVPIYYNKGNRFECPKCGCRLKKGEKQCLCFSILDWSQYK